MGLDELSRRLGWPTRQQVLHPREPALRVRSDAAREKIGAGLKESIRQYHGGDVQCEVGVLATETGFGSSSNPIAVICEFSGPVTDAVLRDAHRLAWNFCRSPLLITVEPFRMRTWSCCE